MAYELSGVDVFFLVKELKTLEGAKVDKITQIDKTLFTIRFFASKQKPVVRFQIPDIVNITQQKYESPKTPLGFCSFLRKYLQNTKLVSVEQKSFERIIIFKFETLKYGELSLILELFKPGNLILCRLEDSKLIVLNALEKQEFKARKIAAREEYVFPPEQNNPASMSEEGIINLFNASGKTVGKFLATDMSLGGTYAQEIIARSGLEKEKTEMTEKELKILSKALIAFFKENVNCSAFKGKIYPVFMQSFEIANDSKFASFNEGLDSIMAGSSSGEGKSSAKKEKKKSKTASLLEIQEKRMRSLDREIDENQRIGEFIYEHYQEFQKLIDSVKALREQNKSFTEIEELLSKNKHFKKLDSAKKVIILNWGDKQQ